MRDISTIPVLWLVLSRDNLQDKQHKIRFMSTRPNMVEEHTGTLHGWLTSWRKSATPFLSGHLNPQSSKNFRAWSRGPWYTIFPSVIKITSSKRSKVSGAGCRMDTSTVASVMWASCWRQAMTWNAVELSKPFVISSMKRALFGPTIISPAHFDTVHSPWNKTSSL